MEASINRKSSAGSALLDAKIIWPAVRSAFVKLDPRFLIKNPVMFVVLIGSFVTTFFFIRDVATGTGSPLFSGQLSLWLWFPSANSDGQPSSWFDQKCLH